MGIHVHKHKADHGQDHQHGYHLTAAAAVEDQEHLDIVKHKNGGGEVGDRHKYEYINGKGGGRGGGGLHRKQKLEDNFRPVQPLNGRQVLDIDTSQKRFSKSSSGNDDDDDDNDEDDDDDEAEDYPEADAQMDQPVETDKPVDPPIYSRSNFGASIKTAKWQLLRNGSQQKSNFVPMTILILFLSTVCRWRM